MPRESMDCLKLFEARVTASGLLQAVDLRAVDERVAQHVERSVQEAEAAPVPSTSDLMSDVYVSY